MKPVESRRLLTIFTSSTEIFLAREFLIALYESFRQAFDCFYDPFIDVLYIRSNKVKINEASDRSSGDKFRQFFVESSVSSNSFLI